MSAGVPNGESGQVGTIEVPDVDPVRARLIRRGLALFSTVEVRSDRATRLRLSAIAFERPLWLSCTAGTATVGLAARLADGAAASWPAAMPSRDTPAALAALSRAEPIIAALEQATGWPLEPVSFAAIEGPVFLFELVDDQDRVAHALELCVPDALLAQLPDQPPAETAWPGDVPMPLHFGCAGPVLEMREVRALDVADVILVSRPGDDVPARLAIRDGEVRRQGTINWHKRIFHVDDADQSDTPDRGVAQAAPTALQDVKVALEFRLDGPTMRIDEIAGLKPGATIPLPEHHGDLTVGILVNGQEIGQGHLVRLGEVYGVQIDVRHGDGPRS